MNKNGKKFEIVLVRSDQDEAKFNEYFGKMPWRALPFNATTEINEAKMKFSVRGIPFMAVLNGNGDVVSKNAVAEIMYCKDNEALIKKYRGE